VRETMLCPQRRFFAVRFANASLVLLRSRLSETSCRVDTGQVSKSDGRRWRGNSAVPQMHFFVRFTKRNRFAQSAIGLSKEKHSPHPSPKDMDSMNGAISLPRFLRVKTKRGTIVEVDVQDLAQVLEERNLMIVALDEGPLPHSLSSPPATIPSNTIVKRQRFYRRRRLCKTCASLGKPCQHSARDPECPFYVVSRDCTICASADHPATRCPQLWEKVFEGSITCSVCGGKGHDENMPVCHFHAKHVCGIYCQLFGRDHEFEEVY